MKNNDIVESRKKQIIDNHNAIYKNSLDSLHRAIEIGKLLTEQKEELPHGEFLPWLKENMPFSDETARKYMKLFQYSDTDKIQSAWNLQEAYRQIESIEAQERQTERQKARQRVQEYRRTGVKPEGWKRGTDDKLLQEEEERDRRIEEAKEQARAAEERRKQERHEREQRRQSWDKVDDFIQEAVENVSQKYQERQTFKEKIRVSHEGVSNQFVDALMDYLEELEDDNRRIQFCYDVIKVCKNIAVEIQQKQYQESKA
jgi:hypothetical protein